MWRTGRALDFASKAPQPAQPDPVPGFLNRPLLVMTMAKLSFPILDFGSPEWEFGSSVALLNGLTVPTLGLFLMVAGATSSGWAGFRWPGVIILATGLATGLLAVVLIGLLFVTTIPIALRSTVAGCCGPPPSPHENLSPANPVIARTATA
jgi:hypothetical protein